MPTIQVLQDVQTRLERGGMGRGGRDSGVYTCICSIRTHVLVTAYTLHTVCIPSCHATFITSCIIICLLRSAKQSWELTVSHLKMYTSYDYPP